MFRVNSSAFRKPLLLVLLLMVVGVGSCSQTGFFGYLNSSDGETWWGLYLILTLAFLLVGFLIYYQILFPQPVTEGLLSEMAVLYVEHQCSYMNLDKAFHRMMKETSEIVPSEDSTGIGFYFDDFGKLKNKQQARASIGIILRTEESFNKAREFVSRCHRYKIAHIPEVETAHTVASAVQLHQLQKLHMLLLDGILLGQIHQPPQQEGRSARR